MTRGFWDQDVIDEAIEKATKKNEKSIRETGLELACEKCGHPNKPYSPLMETMEGNIIHLYNCK